MSVSLAPVHGWRDARAARDDKAQPDGLDLASPSTCFLVGDLEAARAALVDRGVNAPEVGDQFGTRNYVFSYPEARWFAVTLKGRPVEAAGFSPTTHREFVFCGSV